MRCSLVSTILAVIALFCIVAPLNVVAANTPTPPKFPDRYTLSGTFSIPYFNITEPITCEYDAPNQRERLQYYYGMDVTIYRNDIGKQYVISPVINTKKCATLPSGDGDLIPMLPDLSSGWVYKGSKSVNHISCDWWQNVTTALGFVNTYDIYVNSITHAPVQLVMNGYDFVFSSHPDLYIFDFEHWFPNMVDQVAFNKPSICSDNFTIITNSSGPSQSNTRMFQLSRLVPSNNNPLHDRFREFVKKFGKSYDSSLEVSERAGLWLANLQYIESHNSQIPPPSYKMGMNHFGDINNNEWRSLYQPKVSRPRVNSATAVHPEPLDSSALPTAVDWRTKGAVTMVKDQGVCGSCWTFGSTGSLEGAWKIKTDKLVSLSEQQIVDCAWGYSFGGPGGNLGCGGGYASGAFQWIIDNGGIATEQQYPYLMQNGWCRKSIKNSGVRVTGYVNVTATESALQDAVASAGPVAVAIDASHPSFRFYMSGVYYEPQCQNGIDDLDHEVLAIGYGSTSGQDYWLVKNSWSTYWGQQGYIMMSRNRNNNCGIATQPNYPLV